MLDIGNEESLKLPNFKFTYSNAKMTIIQSSSAAVYEYVHCVLQLTLQCLHQESAAETELKVID